MRRTWGRTAVIAWSLAALLLALDAVRFAMLLVAPFAIVFGVASGRAYGWLRGIFAPDAPRAVVLALALLLAILILYRPRIPAYTVANDYAPAMDDAWWDTLTAIRDRAGSDAIVSTWWPYGYWAELAADRRTRVDGGSLPSQVPFWLAQVLFAPTESESGRVVAHARLRVGLPSRRAR